MNVQQVEGQLDAYLHLSDEEVARLVLSLLLEEMLKERLAAFRHAELPSVSADGFKGLYAGVPDHSQVSG